MKKFISLLFAFGIFALLFYIVVTPLWKQFTPSYLSPNIKYRIGSNGHMFTRIKEVKQLDKDSTNILFLGSSHSYRGFDPRIFKKNHLSTFNLGSSAQTPVQTLVLLKRYLDRINPNLIIFEVNPRSFQSDGVESSLDIVANDKNDRYTLAMALKTNHIKTYNTLLYAGFRDLLNLNKDFKEPVQRKNDVYIKGGYVESSIQYYKPRELSPRKIKLFKKQIKAFEQCLKEIEKRDIGLILVYAPITHNLYSSYSNNEYFNRKMSAYSFEYYNFNYKVALNDSLHFVDGHHLNQNGVKLFNKQLIQTLQIESETFKERISHP